MIPKKIYYIWFGKKPKPENVIKNIRSWKKFNPNFEIVEINEDNYDVNKNSFIKAAYKSKKWAFVSDVARLEVVYLNGGIYLDTDVEAVKPFNSLLYNHAFWGLESPDIVNSGLMFGAEKKYETLDKILMLYKEKSFDVNNMKKILTTVMVTNVLKEEGFCFRNKIQYLDDGSKVYPTDFFAPFHYWGGGKITSNTISIHHYAGSWLESSKSSFHLKLIKIKLSVNFYFPKTIHFLDWLRKVF